MDEGLRVILSADVTAYEQGMAKAAQVTQQSVGRMAQNLKGAEASLGTLFSSANKLIPTWQRFSSIFMSPFMREFGGHTKEMSQALSEAYDKVKKGTVTFGDLLRTTKFTGKEMETVSQKIAAIPVDHLDSGLKKAEAALQKFANGQRPLTELRGAIEQLQNALPGMANTAPIDKLIQSLQALQATKKGMNVVGLDVKPQVHVADTLKDIERIKGLISTQKFHFTLTADNTGLQSSLNSAASSATDKVQQINRTLSTVSFIPVSTQPLVQGLQTAVNAVQRLSTGAASVEELDAAIGQLNRAKEGLSNTGALDKFVDKLALLRTEAVKVQTTGIAIDPVVDVAGTLADIEKIKVLVAGQQFSFRLQADGKPLQTSMSQAVTATDTAEEAISASTAGMAKSFEVMTAKAQQSVAEYVQAVAKMDNIPAELKTTVQAPNFAPVIQGIQQVKAEIASTAAAQIPTITPKVDTSSFKSEMVGMGVVADRAAEMVEGSFNQAAQSIVAAAKQAGVSVAQLVQNFNALRGVSPNVLAPNVVPPNFAPVVAAAKAAKVNLDKVFLTPLPPIKVPNVVPPRGLPQLTKQTNEAQFALMNLSRVAQDAPFGFIGIANNINPLLESFQQLRATSGSTGSAFKALAGSLMGPAGLGLAVGVASSLLITFGDKISLFKKKLDIFKEALGEAAKSSSEELVKLKIYADRLNDTTLSNQERIKVAKEYNKIADETNKIDLKQIDNLTILNEKIAAQTALVQQRALSAAAIGKLTDASSKYIEKELELQTQLEATGLTYEQVEKAAQAMFKKQIEGTQAVRKGLDGIQVNKPLLGDKTENQIQGVSNVLISLFNQVKNGKYEFDKLTKSLQNFITIDGLTTKDGGSGKNSKTKKNIENAFKDLADFVKGMNLKAQVDFEAVPKMQLATDWSAAFKESLKQQFDKEINIPLTLNFTPEQIKANALSSPVDKVFTDYMEKFRDAKVKFPVIDLASFVKEGGDKELQEYLQNILSQMTDFRTQVKDILGNAATDSISAFAEGIGQAIAGGNIGNAFSAVLETMGSAIMELGKQMIVGSSIIQAFKKALATLIANPAAGLAVGATMVAVGAAIKAKASQIMKFEDGGIIYGPTMGLMGEYAGASSNPEVVAPLSKLKDMIKGPGGDNFPAYLPMHRISGSNLLLWYARAERSNRRFT